MKITTFNPQIVTKNPEPIIKLFEELGFVQTHNKADIRGIVNSHPHLRQYNTHNQCWDTYSMRNTFTDSPNIKEVIRYFI